MGFGECGARPAHLIILEIIFIILHSLFLSGCSRLNKRYSATDKIVSEVIADRQGVGVNEFSD
jgi:hypothetical protein